MEYSVLTTDDFRAWWASLSEAEQEDNAAVIKLLRVMGPTLPYPYSSGIEGSQYSHLRELRIQHRGQPYRILYAFDPKRQAILLIGGNKTGDKRWYKRHVPIAERLYTEYLQTMKQQQPVKGDLDRGPQTFQ